MPDVSLRLTSGIARYSYLRSQWMFMLPDTVTSRLQGALAAVQHELRLLEQDLGLCANCGAQPPIPFAQRAPRPLHGSKARCGYPRRVA